MIEPHCSLATRSMPIEHYGISIHSSKRYGFWCHTCILKTRITNTTVLKVSKHLGKRHINKKIRVWRMYLMEKLITLELVCLLPHKISKLLTNLEDIQQEMKLWEEITHQKKNSIWQKHMDGVKESMMLCLIYTKKCRILISKEWWMIWRRYTQCEEMMPSGCKLLIELIKIMMVGYLRTSIILLELKIRLKQD